MGKLDKDALFSDSEMDKSNAEEMVDAINDNDHRVTLLESASPIASSDINLYGNNIRNFIKKCRDWSYSTTGNNRNLAIAPKVVFLADSIGNGGSWFESFRDYCVSEFGVPAENWISLQYGGYSMYDFIPNMDSAYIYPNPDLIIFNEYEGAGVTDEYMTLIEAFFQKVKKYTTADIMVGTWSIYGDVAQDIYDGVSTPRDYYLTGENINFNHYRDLSSQYALELVDFNRAIINWVLAGNNPSGKYTSGPHWTTDFYTEVFLPELIKHVGYLSSNSSNLLPNPNRNKEELIFFSDLKQFDTFGDNLISTTKNWGLAQKSNLLNSYASDNDLTIKCNNIIGFQVTGLAIANKSFSYKISDDNGVTWKKPSEIIAHGKPLEYLTEVVKIDSNGDVINGDSWRMARPKIAGIVTSSKGIDNQGTPIRYTFVVTSATKNANDEQVVIIELRKSDGTVLYTLESHDSNGDLKAKPFGDLIDVDGVQFPATMNNVDNFKYTNDGTDDWGQPSYSNFTVGDTYEFYVKANWIDNVELINNRGQSEVFGLERGDYLVKLDNISASASFIAIKLMH